MTTNDDRVGGARVCAESSDHPIPSGPAASWQRLRRRHRQWRYRGA